MGLDYHRAQLEIHCRVCAKVFTGKLYKYTCKTFRDSLLEAFKLDVSKDVPEIHPSYFCHSCYTKGKQYTKGGGHIESVLTIHKWSPHTDSGDV